MLCLLIATELGLVRSPRGRWYFTWSTGAFLPCRLALSPTSHGRRYFTWPGGVLLLFDLTVSATFFFFTRVVGLALVPPFRRCRRCCPCGVLPDEGRYIDCPHLRLEHVDTSLEPLDRLVGVGQLYLPPNIVRGVGAPIGSALSCSGVLPLVVVEPPLVLASSGAPPLLSLPWLKCAAG